MFSYHFYIFVVNIRFIYIMDNRKLTRSNDRMIAGVCAGLAEYFGFDTTIVRIIYTLLTVFTAFSGVIVYIILMIVMPERRW